MEACHWSRGRRKRAFHWSEGKWSTNCCSLALWPQPLRLKIFVPVFVLVIISSVQVVTMGFCLKKNLLIENDEDFFIVQLIVVPLIGVLRVSFALRRSTTLPFSIISTFVLPPCFAFILGILAVSFINESFLLAAGVKCSLFVIFKVFNFCADLPICFGGFLGSFSHIELPRELVLYAVVTRSLKSVLVLPPQIFGPFGPSSLVLPSSLPLPQKCKNWITK